MDDSETARHYETVHHTREVRAPSSTEKRTKVTDSEPEAPRETWKAEFSRTGHEAANINPPEPDNKDESFEAFPNGGEPSPQAHKMGFPAPSTLLRPRLSAQTLAPEDAVDERKAPHRKRRSKITLRRELQPQDKQEPADLVEQARSIRCSIAFLREQTANGTKVAPACQAELRRGRDHLDALLRELEITHGDEERRPESPHDASANTPDPEEQALRDLRESPASIAKIAHVEYERTNLGRLEVNARTGTPKPEPEADRKHSPPSSQDEELTRRFLEKTKTRNRRPRRQIRNLDLRQAIPSEQVLSPYENHDINNPKLLATVEDAIRRLIMPEIKEIRRAAKAEKAKASTKKTSTSPAPHRHGSEELLPERFKRDFQALRSTDPLHSIPEDATVTGPEADYVDERKRAAGHRTGIDEDLD